MHGELKLFCALAVRAAFDDGILAQFAETGGPVTIDWNPTTVVEEKFARGESADLTIVTPAAMDRLVKMGIVRQASRRALVDAYLGVAVAAGAPRPKIGTTDEFLAALKAARSVAYSLGGQSGIYLQKILAEHGLLTEIEARASTIPEGFTAEQIVTGAADLAIQQVSELMVVKGVDIVGPFPEALQTRTHFEIAVCEGTANSEAAAAFIDFLFTPEASASFLRNGVELATK